MSRPSRVSLDIGGGACLAASAVTLLAGSLQAAPVAFVGAEVRTVANGTIEDGVVVFENGIIRAVGSRSEVEIPPGAHVHDLSGKVLIPGLVDTHSHVGIYPRPAVPAHRDGNDVAKPLQGAFSWGHLARVFARRRPRADR